MQQSAAVAAAAAAAEVLLGASLMVEACQALPHLAMHQETFPCCRQHHHHQQQQQKCGQLGALLQVAAAPQGWWNASCQAAACFAAASADVVAGVAS
jgi:hypothetical protein